MVIIVFNGKRFSGHLQGTERVDHYGEFFRFGFADASLVSPGVRSMRNACRMQRNVATINAGSAHKITFYVVQNLIRIDVGMIVRCRNRLGVIIVHPRHKTADDKGIGLECLVDRRGLVHAPCDGLEIVDGHGIRKVVTIPTHHVKRVRSVDIVVQLALFFDANGEFADLIECFQVRRRTHVPLAIRTVLEQLSKMIAVAFWSVNRVSRFRNKQSIGTRIKGKTVNDAPRDHQIITCTKWDFPEHRMQHAAAFVHKHHFVAV